MTPKTQSRKDLLASAWVGDPITIAGKDFCLSAGKFELLSIWGNAFFSESQTGQHPISALGELIYVGCADRDTLEKYRKLGKDERRELVADYMLENEDEFAAAIESVQNRMETVKASAVESEEPGK